MRILQGGRSGHSTGAEEGYASYFTYVGNRESLWGGGGGAVFNAMSSRGIGPLNAGDAYSDFCGSDVGAVSDLEWAIDSEAEIDPSVAESEDGVRRRNTFFILKGDRKEIIAMARRISVQYITMRPLARKRTNVR